MENPQCLVGNVQPTGWLTQGHSITVLLWPFSPFLPLLWPVLINHSLRAVIPVWVKHSSECWTTQATLGPPVFLWCLVLTLSQALLVINTNHHRIGTRPDKTPCCADYIFTVTRRFCWSRFRSLSHHVNLIFFSLPPPRVFLVKSPCSSQMCRLVKSLSQASPCVPTTMIFVLNRR